MEKEVQNLNQTNFFLQQNNKNLRRSQFNKDNFSKKFSAMEVLGMCLPYVKSLFQPH